MEVVENFSSSSSTITTTNNNNTNYKEEDDIPLPGFRFHPTDEELIGFYLRRKIEKRPMRIELIKQTDIYKYDPWDLPKSSGVGDKEWYFFCKRGRKYRNSTRPNRVTGTGSGFWKATGIDKPIYSSGATSAAGDSCIIGLKKSLVYYRGSAGKGTKTDWMMHEFRLPSSNDGGGGKIADHVVTKNFAHQEAEVWTICRILKRNVTNKKCVPNWREIQIAASSAKRSTLLINNDIPIVDENYSKVRCSSSIDSSYQNRQISNYISFTNAQSNYNIIPKYYRQREFSGRNFPSSASSFSSSSNLCANDISDEFLRRGADWEDLRSVVDCAAVANPFYL